MHNVVAGTFGKVGVAVPLVLLGLAIRLMRHPERVEANGRIVIGLGAITLAVCGLVQIGAGLPGTDDLAALRVRGRDRRVPRRHAAGQPAHARRGRRRC